MLDAVAIRKLVRANALTTLVPIGYAGGVVCELLSMPLSLGMLVGIITVAVSVLIVRIEYNSPVDFLVLSACLGGAFALALAMGVITPYYLEVDGRNLQDTSEGGWDASSIFVYGMMATGVGGVGGLLVGVAALAVRGLLRTTALGVLLRM